MVIGYIFSVNVIEPLIKNHFYINQMNTDGISYVLMQGYSYIKGAYIVLFLVLIGSVIYDLYKQYKNKKENENED